MIQNSIKLRVFQITQNIRNNLYYSNMKKFVLIMCLLAIAYAANPEKLKAYYKTYDQCLDQLGLPKFYYEVKPANLEILKCIDEKENMYDKDGAIIKEKLIMYCKDLFITGNEKQGTEIISKCFDKAYQGPENNEEKYTAFIKCCLEHNLMDLIALP